jgi:glycosyltransferase involved in cell wall biosynthesis
MHYTKIEDEDFGFLSGTSYFKGFYLLYSSIKNLRDIRIKVMGTNIGPYSPNIIYVGKIRHLSQEFYDFYKSIKTVVVPTLIPEPRPYIVTEALQMGRLLIASKIGGIPELTQGAKGVKLIEPNPIELAYALEEFSSIDIGTATEIGLFNRELILRRFNNEILVKQFIRILDEVSS